MDLVAGGAARLERFGVVAAAVEASVAVKVDEVDEQLAADAATETRRVPHAAGAGPRRHHRHVAAAHRLAALPPKKKQTKQTNKQTKENRHDHVAVCLWFRSLPIVKKCRWLNVDVGVLKKGVRLGWVRFG